MLLYECDHQIDFDPAEVYRIRENKETSQDPSAECCNPTEQDINKSITAIAMFLLIYCHLLKHGQQSNLFAPLKTTDVPAEGFDDRCNDAAKDKKH